MTGEQLWDYGEENGAVLVGSKHSQNTIAGLSLVTGVTDSEMCRLENSSKMNVEKKGPCAFW